MIKETLIKELNELIHLCSSSENIELIDLICRYEGNNLILSVLVDKPQGNGLASFGQSHNAGQNLEIPLIKINKARLVI